MKQLKSPISVHYEITEKCNHQCEHCYNPFSHVSDSVVPEAIREGIIDELIKNEVFHVIVTGGEPLFYKDIALHTIRRLNERGTVVSMNSNLTLIDRQTASDIKEAGVKSVLTSVIHYNPKIHDSVTKVKGSLERCMNGIAYLVEQDIPVSANMVVTKDRVLDVYSTGKRLVSSGITGFSATRMAPNPNNIKEILNAREVEQMLDQLLMLSQEYGIRVSSLNNIPRCFSSNPNYFMFMDRSCNGGRTSATITQEGGLKSCHHLEDVVGNIVEEGLTTVWERAPVLKDERLPKECSMCDSNESCAGGCRQTAQVVKGKKLSLDPIAKGRKYAVNYPSAKTKPDLDVKLRFMKDTLHRKEREGGVLFRNPRNYVILSESQYQLALKLANNSFSIMELTDIIGEEVGSFVEKLYQKGLVGEAKWKD